MEKAKRKRGSKRSRKEEPSCLAEAAPRVRVPCFAGGKLGDLLANLMIANEGR